MVRDEVVEALLKDIERSERRWRGTILNFFSLFYKMYNY